MTTSKFTVVIPTMWRYEPFIGFLSSLEKCSEVDEIIIINNDVAKTPDFYLDTRKTKVIDFDPQIYINPAWNLGVSLARNELICVANDDIEFDLEVFKVLQDKLEPKHGIFGLCPGKEEFNQPVYTSTDITVKPWEGEHTYGFGCLMFFHRQSWTPIPEDLKIYFGDNWVFDVPLIKGKQNFIITNLEHYTPYAVTCSETGKGFLEIERPIFDEHKQKVVFSWEELKQAYQVAAERNSDIKEHIPTLYNLAKEVNSVVEFGVRTGVSTSAFLYSGCRLNSYDLWLDDWVKQLFQYATECGSHVQYQQMDSRLADIPQADLLFIDTLHEYKHLKEELYTHHDKINKYIVMHDTQLCAGSSGEDPIGLAASILEFLAENKQWRVHSHYHNNNGLTVLERITV